MDTIEEKIGYLVAKMEEHGHDLRKVITKVETLEKTVSEKLTTIDTLFKVVKFGGIVIVAVLTFQFGDISRWWHHLFG